MNKEKQSKNSNHNDGYFDNCPICQAMKKKGITMQRYPDEVKDDKNEGIWKDGFYATPIEPREVKEMKRLFKKHGGTVVDERN